MVCIANLTTSAVHTDYDVTPAQMNEIRTFGQLEAFRAPLSNRTVERSTQFFMTGYGYRKDSDGNPDKTQTSITIPDNLTEEVEVDCILSPRRMDAKVTFNVKTEPLRDTWTDFDFRPRSWRVVNVPVRSPLLPDDDGGDEGVSRRRRVVLFRYPADRLRVGQARRKLSFRGRRLHFLHARKPSCAQEVH